MYCFMNDEVALSYFIKGEPGEIELGYLVKDPPEEELNPAEICMYDYGVCIDAGELEQDCLIAYDNCLYLL